MRFWLSYRGLFVGLFFCIFIYVNNETICRILHSVIRVFDTNTCIYINIYSFLNVLMLLIIRRLNYDNKIKEIR